MNFLIPSRYELNCTTTLPGHWPNESSVRQWSRGLEFNRKSSHTNDSKMVLDSTLLNIQHYKCCGLQIRPVEEQLKQRVMGERYCISRKKKSYKGSTSHARLTVRQSNASWGTRSCPSPERAKLRDVFRLDESIFLVWWDTSP